MTATRKKVYLAGALFCVAERAATKALAEVLRERGYDPREPWQFCKGVENNAAEVRRRCIDELRRADLLVANLDGADPDSGVAVEWGYAEAIKLPRIGYRGDFRKSGDDSETGMNAMFRNADMLVDTSGIDYDLTEQARRVAGAVDRYGKDSDTVGA